MSCPPRPTSTSWAGGGSAGSGGRWIAFLRHVRGTFLVELVGRGGVAAATVVEFAGTLIELAGLLAPRPLAGHKGTFGHVLVIGGEPGKTGAAAMTGEAADAFLGTQGDPWDTQKDILLAGFGAIAAQLGLAPAHDRQIEKLARVSSTR